MTQLPLNPRNDRYLQKYGHCPLCSSGSDSEPHRHSPGKAEEI